MTLTKRLILAFVLSALGPLTSFAAHIKGKVTDENGNPLEFVAVSIVGTTSGTVTNAQGEYNLNLKAGTYTLQCYMIGYKTEANTITVEGEKKYRWDVVMKVDGQLLNSIVISANRKDLIRRLIRGASDQREYFEQKRATYSSDGYLKTSLLHEQVYRDTTDTVSKTPVYLTKKYVEEMSESTFKRIQVNQELKLEITGFRNFEAIQRDRFSYGSVSFTYGDLDLVGDRDRYENPYILHSTSAFNQFSLAENTIKLPELCDKPIVSPIASTALLSYKYDIVDIDTLNNERFYKLSLQPIFKQEALFSGYIWIQDTTFVVGKIDLELSDEAMPFFKEFSWKEEFTEVAPDVWMSYERNLKTLVNEKKDSFTGTNELKFSNYAFDNIALPNINKNEDLKYTEKAFDQDSVFWTANSLNPFSSFELKYIHENDSLQKVYDNPELQAERDSAYNHVSFWDVTLNGIAWRNREKGTTYFINPLTMQMVFYGIGGYRQRFGGNFTKLFENDFLLETDGFIDYGFNNKDVRGRLGVGLTYNPKKFVRTFVRVGDSYERINGYASLGSVFSRSNYVRAKSFSIAQRMEVVNGIYAELTLDYSDQNPIKDMVMDQWSTDLFGEVNKPIDFQRYTKVELRLDMQIRFQQSYYYKRNRKVVTGYKYPELKVTYRKGIPSIFGSSVNFDFFEIAAADEYQTARLGSGNWGIQAGTFLNKKSLRIVEYKYFRGSDAGFFSDPTKSFQLLGQTLNTADAYYRANYIHHFNGMLLNKIPLIKRLQLYESAGAGYLAIPSQNFFHQEYFVGLEHNLRIKRQLFRVGLFAVTADSTVSKAQITYKFGISFWNSYTKKWSF